MMTYKSSCQRIEPQRALFRPPPRSFSEPGVPLACHSGSWPLPRESPRLSSRASNRVPSHPASPRCSDSCTGADSAFVLLRLRRTAWIDRRSGTCSACRRRNARVSTSNPIVGRSRSSTARGGHERHRLCAGADHRVVERCGRPIHRHRRRRSGSPGSCLDDTGSGHLLRDRQTQSGAPGSGNPTGHRRRYGATRRGAHPAAARSSAAQGACEVPLLGP
jgi:hypothetical protein